MRDLKPTELVVLGGALVGGIARLGFATLRAREELAGISPLSYPQPELVWAGANALAALPLRALAAFTHPVLRGSAAVLLALMLVLYATRWLGRLRSAAILLLLAVALIVLTVGADLYRIALRATNLEGEEVPQGGPCGSDPKPDLASRMTFETCSWLTNESLRNEQRREGFDGLLAWLLLACLAAVWTGVRAPGLAGLGAGLRGALVGALLLVLLFLLYQVPRAHAFAEWGLRYPSVRVKERCGGDVAGAINSGACCAYDVSAGAQKTTLLLRGNRCPPELRGALILGTGSDDGRDCLVAITRPRVIYRGCE